MKFFYATTKISKTLAIEDLPQLLGQPIIQPHSFIADPNKLSDIQYAIRLIDH
mgnify:CR=1 FL=1